MSIWTRPDIAFSVSILSRFLQCLAKTHLDLEFQVLGYLKRKPLPGLLFTKTGNSTLFDLIDDDSLVRHGYADASWNEKNRRLSQYYGLRIASRFHSSSLVLKASRIVSLSTAEAELVSATKCGQETCFLRMMLEFWDFLRISQQLFSRITMPVKKKLGIAQPPLQIQA